MSVLDFLQRRRSEKALEDLLSAYPQLIAPGLKNPRRQEVLSRASRTDLVFYFPKRVVVVEIKRGLAGVAALRQLERYLREHRGRGFKVEGILLAHRFNPACLEARKASHWNLSCKCLDRDVPVNIVICANCREPRDRRVERCSHDGSTEVLNLHP